MRQLLYKLGLVDNPLSYKDMYNSAIHSLNAQIDENVALSRRNSELTNKLFILENQCKAEDTCSDPDPLESPVIQLKEKISEDKPNTKKKAGRKRSIKPKKD